MKRYSRFVTALLAIAVLAASIFGILNRQAILDYIALRNYEPDSRIVSLADETTMQDPLRKVFYANHPRLNDKTSFRQNCPSTEHSIVLGCYIERNGIFLLDVTDQRLKGVIQVTAAHEALHAQYDRLSSKERRRIDNLVSQFYAGIQDPRIKKTVEQYRSKDPGIVNNELHSILGTEIRQLSPELETYYAKYFKNRAALVALSEKYEQTFVDLTEQVAELDSQLRSLKETIASNQVEIEGLNSELERSKVNLDSLINSGRTEEYNAAVPGFNAQVREYNALIGNTRQLINQYNAMVEKRNAIATTEQELVEAINSNAQPRQAR